MYLELRPLFAETNTGGAGRGRMHARGPFLHLCQITPLQRYHGRLERNEYVRMECRLCNILIQIHSSAPSLK